MRRPDALLAWLRAYAAASSTNASYNRILDAATPGDGEKPARSTTEQYRDVLQQLWILEPLPAWLPGTARLQRLAQAPKQAAEARVYQLRTRNGDHEVDLIVERADGRVVAIEVKLSPVVSESDVRHLQWLRERVGDELIDAVVVTTGPHAYRRRDGIAVVRAATLGP